VNKRPGNVKVTIESGYCSFCDRTRNLRREERQLGALVRTVVTCESCHRTLSSSMGVAAAEETPAAAEAAPAATDAAAPEPAEAPKPAPARKDATPRKAPAARKTESSRKK
jgi:hypothetical protein